MRAFLFALSLASLSLSSCAFNVSVREAVRDAATAETFTRVRSNLVDAGLRDGLVHVTGSARTGALATMRLGALVSGGGGDAGAGAILRWEPVLGGVAVLTARGTESSWIDELAIDVPSASGIDLDVAGADVVVEGTGGPVFVHTHGGAIDVTSATEVMLQSNGGPITVEAERGNVASFGGSLMLDVSGEVIASSSSGSIRGRVGGGEMESAGGTIDVTLTRALEGDMYVGSTGGAITLGIPAGASLELDVESSSGHVRIAAGGVTYDGMGAVTRTLGAGGPLLSIRSQNGSITVVER